MNKTKENTIYLRISDEMAGNVATAKTRMGLSKPELMRIVMEAAIKALADVDYRVSLPITFHAVTATGFPPASRPLSLNEKPPSRH